MLTGPFSHQQQGAELERRTGVRSTDKQTRGQQTAERLPYDHQGSARRLLPMIIKCVQGARCSFERRERPRR